MVPTSGQQVLYLVRRNVQKGHPCYIQSQLIPTLLKKFRLQMAIVATGITVLCTFNVLLQLDSQSFLYPDSKGYLESCRNLFLFARGHQYRPLLMAFLNGWPLLFSRSDNVVLQWSLFVNVAAWLGTAVVLFALLKEKGAKVALVVSLVFLVSPGIAAMNFHLLADVLFIFFLIAFFYLLSRYFNTGTSVWLTVGLAVLLLSTLIKPASQFLAVLFVGYFFKTLWKFRLKKVMLPLYGAFCLVLLQMGGLKYQFGDFTLSYTDATTLHDYLLAKSQAFADGKPYKAGVNERSVAFFELSAHEQKIAARRDLRLQLSQHPLQVFRAYADDIAENISGGSDVVRDCRNVLDSSYFAKSKSFLLGFSTVENLFFSIAGVLISVYFLLKRGKNKSAGAAAVIILYLTLISGISNGEGDRFQIAVYPFVLFLMAYLWKEPSTTRFSALLQK